MNHRVITSPTGIAFEIRHTTAAYNAQSKEAFFYIEMQRRVEQKYLEKQMVEMGATLINTKIFTVKNWEDESFEALRSVKSYASKEGFILMQAGTEPSNSALFHTKVSGIYVLSVENRPKPFFYVGKAEDIGRRIQQHLDGTGAACITGEPFTRVEPVTKGSLF
jgi:hypothetical protein